MMAKYWGILVVVMVMMLLSSCSLFDKWVARKEVMLVLSVVLQCWDHFLPDSDLKTMISLVVSDMVAK